MWRHRPGTAGGMHGGHLLGRRLPLDRRVTIVDSSDPFTDIVRQPTTDRILIEVLEMQETNSFAA